jgi:hypothetical protein
MARIGWKSVTEQVIAGLLIAATLALVAVAKGLVSGIPIKVTFAHIDAALAKPIGVPVWLVAAALLVIVSLSLSAFARRPTKSQTGSRGKVEDLTSDELALMHVFHRNDISEAPLVKLREHLGITQLRFDEAVAGLERRDFIWSDTNGYLSQHKIHLQPNGRTWLLSVLSKN